MHACLDNACGDEYMFLVHTEHNGIFCGIGHKLDYVSGARELVDGYGTETMTRARALWVRCRAKKPMREDGSDQRLRRKAESGMRFSHHLDATCSEIGRRHRQRVPES